MNKIKKEYKILIFIFILILIDQISKFIAFKNNDFIVINGVLKFKIFNDVSGCYGVNTNSTIMYILTNLIVAIIAFQFITSQNQFVDKKIKVFLSLIIAGGISNCIDRVFRGYVLEFIDFTDFLNVPILNLADIFILIGWIAMAAIFASFTAKELKNRKSIKKE
jgi:signal peptidase II